MTDPTLTDPIDPAADVTDDDDTASDAIPDEDGFEEDPRG